MAEQVTQDVVNEAQSMGDPSPIDAIATTTQSTIAGDGEALSKPSATSSKPSAPSGSSFPKIANVDKSTPARSEAVVVANGEVRPTPEEGKPEKTPSAEILPNKPRRPVVNGQSRGHLSTEDVLVPPAIADASGGSDTDTSKADSIDHPKDGQGKHLRTYSVKKPASFKPVSVTKNFLAKAAVSSSLSRPGDKASTGQTTTINQQTAKPRLVAKSGGGFGNSVPRSGLSKLNGAGGGPDANMVWNKNRPVPPPPPKQMTDEELKQYGIHMATRLQADEPGKESKWADIDDDEDDWAPDAVEWMDGTKSTLATAESTKAIAAEAKSVPSKKEKEKEREKEREREREREKEKPAEGKTVLPAPQRPSVTNSAKTILKPGAHVAASQGKTGGLILKGSPEKPALVAKTSAPPTKSPWAPLPPIDKISPVVPPTQQPSRFSQRDPHGFDALPPPTAAKEIAADDFNRSWRGDRGNKELFNSQSGRYEPVGETRRGSVRHDDSFRQPSVLQRPSQLNQPEPSPAFQTSRSTSAVDGPWARRRGSSNVSGGSGRRLSFGRAQDGPPPMPAELHTRRGSQSLTGSEAATPAGTPRTMFAQRATYERGVSPVGPRWAQRSSPGASHAQPASPYGSAASLSSAEAAPGPVQPPPDPVLIQQQVMREKIEKARLEKQRQREQEEQEEVARKERLRLKMEALGPAPPSYHDKAKKEVTGPEVSKHAPVKAPALHPSPPKPPVPTSEDEVVQYGLIKVHQPHPVKKHAAAAPPAADLAPSEARVGLTQKAPTPPVKAPSPAVQPPAGATKREADDQSLPSTETRVGSSPLSGWANQSSSTGPANAGLGNVWGPPAPLSRDRGDRALGNGTFEHNFNFNSRLQHSQSTLPSTSSGTIVPPPASEANRSNPFVPPQNPDPLQNLSPQPSSSLQTSQSLPSQPHQGQSLSSQPFAEQASSSSSSSNSMATATLAVRPLTMHGPIGPPNRLPADQHDARVLQWNALPSLLHTQEKAQSAQMRAKWESGERVVKNFDIDEDFKKTSGDGRKVVERAKQADSFIAAKASEKTQAGLAAPFEERSASNRAPAERSTAPGHARLPSNPNEADEWMRTMTENLKKSGLLEKYSKRPSSGSRYFPHKAGTSATHSPVQSPPRSPSYSPPKPSVARRARSTARSTKSNSPPPPETTSHPAYDGDAARPKVNLPVPKARVKLPPAPPAPAAPATAMPPRHDLLPLGHRPIVNQPDWQSKFSNLLGKPVAITTSTPKPDHTLAVSSASKAPLDVSAHHTSATVSLPSNEAKFARTALFTVDYDSNAISKVTAEEDFMEEREFGSRPFVRMPKQPHMRAFELPALGPTIRPQSNHYRAVQATTRTPLPQRLSDCEEVRGGYKILISLPGHGVKTAVLPRPRSHRSSNANSNSSSHKSSSHKKKNFAPRDGSNNAQSSRSRKASSNFQSSGNGQGASPRPSASGTTWMSTRSGSRGSSWNNRSAGAGH